MSICASFETMGKDDRPRKCPCANGNAILPLLTLMPGSAGSRLGEAFLDFAGRKTVELTIPHGAHIRGDLRQMQRLVLRLKAKPHNQVRRDGDDFFPCRIKEWQAHCVSQFRSRRASETTTASRPG